MDARQEGDMFNARLLAKIVAIQVAFVPVIAFADDDTELNATMGRAGVLLERASDGLTKLGARKGKITQEWANGLQDKAADICAFVKKELETANPNDEEVAALCSVE
jgi:hypothetical protein